MTPRRPTRRRPAVRSARPSRSAAIGGTRVARRAGMSAATTVDRDADHQRDDDRPRLRRRCRRRQADPERIEQRVDALREAEPASSPSTDAEQADRAAPRRTPRRASGGATAPSVRSIAELADALGDGDREGVEDQEGADEQRHAGEHQQEGRQEAEGVADLVRCCGLAFSSRGLDLDAGGTTRSIRALQLSGRRRRSPRPRSGRSGRRLPVMRWASGSVSWAMLAPPKDAPPSSASPTSR